MSRKLIIDLQVFQSPAWDRGIGKFTLELISGILDKQNIYGWDEVIGIFSNKRVKTKDLRDLINNKFKKMQSVWLDLLPDDIGNKKIVEHNKKIINEYLESYLIKNNDTIIDYLLPSPMQGYICAPFPNESPSINKIALAHDLIPLTFHDLYLESNITREEYLSRFQDFLRADIFVTNSKTTANDLSTYLCIDNERIFSIDGAPINHSEKTKKYSAPTPFILMPTGNDLRKNNERAIKAFKIFNKIHNNTYTLVLTSYFEDYQIKLLQSFSDKLLFTGNIDGAKLNYLYQKSDAVLFPSEYEGLGLPILEAMKFNKKIACSEISVFKEISSSDFVYFDPYSINEIVKALEIITGNFNLNKANYSHILEYYNWDNTVNKFATAIFNFSKPKDLIQKPNIAIFSPNPSGSSKAGKIVQNSYAEMVKITNIDYYLSSNQSNETRINFLPYVEKCKYIEKGMSYNSRLYNHTLYFIDSSESSTPIMFSALGGKGNVVLFDMNLSLLWKNMVERGLIDNSRIKLEKELASKMNLSDYWYLISLFSRQDKIISINNENTNIIKKISNKINKKIEVINLQIPVSNLVYDIKSEQKIEIFSKLSIINNISDSDFSRNNLISKYKFLIIDTPDYEDTLIDTLRLKTVPVLSRKKAQKINLDSNVYIEDEFFNDLLVKENKNHIDEEYKKSICRVNEYLNYHLDYKNYVKKLLSSSKI